MSTVSTESTLAAPRQPGSRAFTLWIAILVALILLGFGVWIYQLAKGLQITNMRDNVIWGLYIITFMFFVGLSAGGLIIASAGRLFGVERFAPIVRLAVVEATVAIATAALLIIPDLGHVQRIYNLFIHAHWLSPMIWDITVILIYLVLSLLYLWLYMRRDLAARGSWLALGDQGHGPGRGRDRDHRLTYGLAWIALPAAVLVHSITAWIFGLQISRGFWYSAIMPPLFISSALVSGLALVIDPRVPRAPQRSHLVRRRPGELPRRPAGRVRGGRGLPRAVRGPRRLLPGHPDRRGAPALQRPLRARLRCGDRRGARDPVHPAGRRRVASPAGLVVIACVLALIGIFVHRANLIVIGLGKDPIALPPGTPLGTPQANGSSFAASSVYFPSVWEFLIVLGIVALSALMFTLAVRYLPLREKSST